MDPCTDRDDRLITHLGGFPGQAIRDLVPRTRQIFGRLPTVARRVESDNVLGLGWS